MFISLSVACLDKFSIKQTKKVKCGFILQNEVEILLINSIQWQGLFRLVLLIYINIYIYIYIYYSQKIMPYICIYVQFFFKECVQWKCFHYIGSTCTNLSLLVLCSQHQTTLANNMIMHFQTSLIIVIQLCCDTGHCRLFFCCQNQTETHA